MPINITMPALSPTMEEGNLAKWLVKEGDKVSSGDVIAEIETDKATMEVEAVDEGTVAKIVVPAGTEGVKVNAVIAVLAAEGEDAGAAAKAVAPQQPAPRRKAASAPKAEAGRGKPRPRRQPAAAPAPEQGGAGRQRSRDWRPHLRFAACPPHRQGCRHRCLGGTGTGPHGRVVKADVEAAIAGGGAKAAPAASRPPGAAPAAAPAARRCRTRRC